MRFWDSSAILPLLIQEPQTKVVQALYQSDTELVVWWGTPIECISALARLERENQATTETASTVIERLDALSFCWHEIQPTEGIRAMSKRLLRVHPLRAADSMQLAAALLAFDQISHPREFVSLDTRLSTAAMREGFSIIPR